MKIDFGYISKILSVFLDSEEAHININININTFSNAGISIYKERNRLNEQFLFHFQILVENSLISDRNLIAGSLSSLGIKFSSRNEVFLVITELRLTQRGHDFASALNNKEVLQKLKSELKDAPFKTVFDGSQILLQHLFKKKLDNLLGESA